jgi:DNA-binding transcriptional LysR family regulator
MADEDPTLRVERLTHSQGYFAVRPEHSLAARPEATLADVLRFPLVTTSRLSSHIMENLLGAVSPARRPELVTIACESIAMMKGIAFGSEAVAALPMRAMFAEVRAGALVPLPLRPPWLRGRFGIVSLRERAHSEVALRFVGILKEVDAETEARAREEERRIFGTAERGAEAPEGPRAKRQRSG